MWKQVGEALLVGRKEHKADQKFSQRCKDSGFDMDRRVRADAMWFAQSGVCPTDTDAYTPTEIRRWFNDQPKEPLPSDLTDIKIEVKPFQDWVTKVVLPAIPESSGARARTACR